MDYIGLLDKFPVNRPITIEEIENHLPQDKPSLSRPLCQLSVIRMNSTYLECVDKFFGWKGSFSAFAIVALSMPFSLFIWITLSEISRPEGIQTDALWLIAFAFLGCIGIYFLFGPVLKKECFQYTHNPIRFNRKTRMVHVFRQNGTVMSEPWETLFFTLCRTQDDNWEVRGHRLADDRRTVVETFALSYFGPLDDPNDPNDPDPFIWGQWEFVRRYMEDGPAELVDQVEWVMDVAERRETFLRGFFRLLAPFGKAWPLAILMSPFCLFSALGRGFAMRVGKIPYWPKEIEDQCQIDPDDPYLRDAKHLAKK
jgi:hypothetical protein